MAENFLGAHRYSAQRGIFDAHPISRDRIRTDIQGLRAVAVLAVLLCHLWPNLIPGGFVGVDVFFVISGYLITGSLFSELQRTGHIGLLRFYVRRMKRLLPAATLVLIVVAVLSLCLLPPSRWEDTAVEIVASAFYLENWRLAWLAVDYFGAENSASPVQHFWSLSIEEQFYIVWPLLMIAAGTALRRFVDLRMAVTIPLLMIAAMSLAASVAVTGTNPETAYFVTHTRLWELGVGGLLAVAVLPDLSRRVREAMRAIGLAAIMLAIFGFSTETAFPGYAALLPTLGCALVIAAGPDSQTRSVAKLLAARPAQYVGDISYSIYLWHWPMVVFAGLYAPDGITLVLGSTIIAATLLVSHISKQYVEDPIRYSKIDPKRALAFTAGLIAFCVIGVAAVYHHIALQLINTHADSPSYPGARALFSGAQVPQVAAPLPPLLFLKKDKAEPYKLNCHVGGGESELNPCRFGPENGVKVVLMGDSHAAQWAPALISQADERGWRLETHTKSACAVIGKPLAKGELAALTCKKWGENLLEEFRRSPPALVVVSQTKSHQVEEAKGQMSKQQIAAGYADIWRQLLALGIKVVAIRDTPHLRFDPGDCLARDPDCHAEQSVVLAEEDPILLAHELAPEVPVVDMTDAICRDGKCPMVIGNVIVWRDTTHLTASYSRTLATVLAARIVEAAGGLTLRPTQ